jgi:predicted PurR-regulated permease PerM
LWVGVVLTALTFLWLVRAVLFPFIISVAIAALLEPLIRWLVGRGVDKRVAVIGVMSIFFLTVLLVGVLAAPTVVRQISGLTVKAQELTRTIIEDGERENYFVRWQPQTVVDRLETPSGQVDRLLQRYGTTLEQVGLPSTRRGIVDRYINTNRTKIADFVQGAFDSFFGILGGLFSQFFVVFLIPVIVTMILFEIDKLKQSTPKWIPPSIRQGTLAIAREVSDVFFGYLRGMSLLILYFTIAETTLLTVLGFPFTMLLGIVFGAFYLIPIIGNFISGASIFLIIGFTGTSGNFMFQVGNPWLYAFLVAAVFLLLGAAFDTFVVPQVVGDSVGLSPVLSIFVVMAGQALFGLPGMVLAFPIAGSVKVILDRILNVATAPSSGLGMPAVPLRHRRRV